MLLARLKWDSVKNQRQPNNQGRGYGNFKQPVQVWQHQQQQNVPDRFNHPPYINTSVPEDIQIVQHYAQPHMPQMVSVYVT